MANTIKPADLGKVISEELTIYSEGVTERVNEAGRKAVKNLVKRTKATVPVKTGDFKKHIASKEEAASRGMKKFTWYVRPPEHRVTHLLVHGHLKPNGGRTKSDPFLQNAWDKVRAEYEKDVEEAVKG